MLSPGEFYKKVPRDLAGNLDYRKRIVKLCDSDAGHRRAALEMCRLDILYYINTFVWQFNPRKKGGLEVAPFITWDFQDEAIIGKDRQHPGILWAIENDEDLVVMKSREMGASWLFLIIMDWMARSYRNQQFLMISKSQEAVQSPSPDSLFWKIGFIHRNLPTWLRGSIVPSKMAFTYLDTESTITGEASTGRAGVGGRATAMFIDEFPQIKEDYEVLHRTSDTTGCRIFNGTHKGLATAFYELTQRVDIKKLTMHWSQHPDKWPGAYRYDPAKCKVEVLDKQYQYQLDFNYVMDGSPTGGPFPGLRSPWYDKECIRKGSDRAVAEDLDINPGGSVSQFFQPLLIRDLKSQYARDPQWEGDLQHDADGNPIQLVQAQGGLLKLWLTPGPKNEVPPGPYAIGVDNSTGQGATPTCLSIVHCDTGEKVGEYVNAHIEPTPFAPWAVAICKIFKDAQGSPARLLWEIPGVGQIFGKRVIELGFRNVYFTGKEFSLWDDTQQERPGWISNSTGDAKLSLLSEYREALALRHFLNRSAYALSICLGFQYDKRGKVVHAKEQQTNDPASAGTNHGDITIADALAWRGCKGLFGRKQKEEEEQVKVGTLAWRRLLHYNRLRGVEAEY
jgi:hypothetical protein